MLARKNYCAINLTTDRIDTATLFQVAKQPFQLSILIASICFLHCHSTYLAGQEILAPRFSEPAPQTAANPISLPQQEQQDDLDNDLDGDPRQALMSGPMHEAFLEVHDADPKPNAIVKKTPPEPINEVPPEYKPEGENVLWIPGYWGWDFEKEDFVWVSGLWRDIPPDRKWIPGYWQKVDEGFRWISGYWQLESDEDIDYLPEPPASIDSGPSTPAPGDDYFYVPGTWIMNNTTYQWSPGYWQACVNDWVWVPTRYIWTPHGCIYRPGYWDRVIGRRGVVFAPVYYSTPFYRNIGYRYTPRYSINVGVRLLPHLFVNLRYGHFYYGNWYGSSFRRHGICSWVNAHRHHRRYYDPLLTYYSHPARRYNNRNCYSWARDHHLQVVQHPHLRPARRFGGPVRREGVSGSVQIRNGSVNIGVRYTDLVRNSKRPPNGLKTAKGVVGHTHVHHKFRHLSKSDLQLETKRIKPIQEVRVARRSHEVRVNRPSNTKGRSQGTRARDGGRGKLSLEKYVAANRKPNPSNRGTNNPSRFASKDRPGRSSTPRPNGTNRGSNPKGANRPTKGLSTNRGNKGPSTKGSASNTTRSTRPVRSPANPSSGATRPRPAISGAEAGPRNSGRPNGNPKKDNSRSDRPKKSEASKGKGKAPARQPTNPDRLTPNSRPGSQNTPTRNPKPPTRSKSEPGKSKGNAAPKERTPQSPRGGSSSGRPGFTNPRKPSIRTSPKNPPVKPAVRQPITRKPSPSVPATGKPKPNQPTRIIPNRSSNRPVTPTPKPRVLPPTRSQPSASDRRQQIEQARRQAIERSQKIQADRARQRQQSLDKQRADAARAQQAAAARRKQIEADAQRRAAASRAARAKAIQDAQRRAEEARRQAAQRRARSSIKPNLPKPKPTPQRSRPSFSGGGRKKGGRK